MAQKNKTKREERVSAMGWVEDHKDLGSGGSCYNMPKGTVFFSPDKEEEYHVDFIPYRVTEKHPLVIAGKLTKGNRTYQLTYFCHFGIGVGSDKKSVVCNAHMFKKKCAVCDFRNKLFQEAERDEASDKLAKDIKVKERQLFFIKDLSDPKKVKVWDISYYNFGEFLLNKIKRTKDPKKQENYSLFADPKVGKTVILGAQSKSIGKNEFLQFPDIQFENREEPITDMLKETFPLEECFEPHNYKEVMAIMEGGEAPEEEEEEDEDDDGEDTEGDDDEAGDSDDEDDNESDSDDESDDESDSEDDEESEDEEDSDDEEADEDDEEEDSESSEDEEDSDDEEADEIVVGDKVTFMDGKKRRKGRVTKINKKNNMALVKVFGSDEMPEGVALDDLSLVESEPAAKPKGKHTKDTSKPGNKPKVGAGKKKRDDDSDPF